MIRFVHCVDDVAAKKISFEKETRWGAIEWEFWWINNGHLTVVMNAHTGEDPHGLVTQILPHQQAVGISTSIRLWTDTVSSRQSLIKLDWPNIPNLDVTIEDDEIGTSESSK